jgi:hypothetical protein
MAQATSVAFKALAAICARFAPRYRSTHSTFILSIYPNINLSIENLVNDIYSHRRLQAIAPLVTAL